MRDKLVVLANAFWSDGGAHYLVATGPQLVVRPNALGTDIDLSMVHAGAGSAGLEWRASPKQAFAVYYGADYYGRNSFSTRRTRRIPEPSLDSVVPALRTPTIVRFSKPLSIGCKRSGSIRATVPFKLMSSIPI